MLVELLFTLLMFGWYNKSMRYSLPAAAVVFTVSEFVEFSGTDLAGVWNSGWLFEGITVHCNLSVFQCIRLTFISLSTQLICQKNPLQCLALCLQTECPSSTQTVIWCPNFLHFDKEENCSILTSWLTTISIIFRKTDQLCPEKLHNSSHLFLTWQECTSIPNMNGNNQVKAELIQGSLCKNYTY